ncbi:hypothetical protein L6452_00937 [Arctium lappa]|uniref:Uncharacterized protein n=1 Tax=Arctium lappa TaxID=4217 RepID=A0ACB9FER8_ARCLA|nr:hypothetical protein L6452_00937 [Arctium lappa]
MATMVNLWICELTKLRDKIQSEKKQKKQTNLFLKSQQQEEVESTKSRAKSASVLPAATAEKELSEETVFWLMDRFSPC